MSADYMQASSTSQDGAFLKEQVLLDDIQNKQVTSEHESTTKQPVRSKPKYVPPLNFSLVEDGIYRSGFPMPINFPFLEQLGLKTIVYLGDLGHERTKLKKDKKDKKDKEKEDKKDKEKEDKKEEKKEKKDKKDKKDKQSTIEIMENYKQWISTTDIKFHVLLMEPSQEPFNSPELQKQSQELLEKALQLILDKNNFPMLIHSNKGKHRTGLLVGLMRKLLQGWCMSGIFEEYEKFALGKLEFDLELIELWQPSLWVDDDRKPAFVRV